MDLAIVFHQYPIGLDSIYILCNIKDIYTDIICRA
jgi:hypothetical protein